MSTPWISWPWIVGMAFIFVYLALSALILASLFRCRALKSRSKWLLALLCAVFLLVAFKHGFVRSDHILISFISLMFILFTLSLLYTDRYVTRSLLLVFAVVVGISFRQDPAMRAEVKQQFGVGVTANWGGNRRRAIIRFVAQKAPETFARVTYKSTVSTYTDAWEGLRLRLSNHGLQRRFETAISNIQKEYSPPVSEGTIDIYTYEQSIPLASSLKWSPRPVFQSYSADLPRLAEINERHLRDATAPDWILIDLLAVDQRFPLLEDGLSWPSLFDNYAFRSFDGQFILMQRNDVIHGKTDMELISQSTQPMGATVRMPERGEQSLFAEVDVEPTLPGRLLTVLLNPPELYLTVKLKNGGSSTYRVVAQMMKTGFILSPLVRNTGELAAFATADREFEDGAKVESISIAPSYGGSIFWANTYTLRLKAYRPPAKD